MPMCERSPSTGIEGRTIEPTTAWTELIAFRPVDGTLRVPDLLSNVPAIEVGDERLNPSCSTASRRLGNPSATSSRTGSSSATAVGRGYFLCQNTLIRL